MQKVNLHKTVSANSKGILISFRDVNKHRFLAYEKVDRIQKYGTVCYQELEPNPLNKTQQRLYSETIYGLHYFRQKEIKKMSASKKAYIVFRYEKAQITLNRWKQQIVNQAVDNFLLSLFPKSPVVKKFVTLPCTDDDYTDKHSFKELGINQKMIIEKLIEHGLLPVNFFQLA